MRQVRDRSRMISSPRPFGIHLSQTVQRKGKSVRSNSMLAVSFITASIFLARYRGYSIGYKHPHSLVRKETIALRPLLCKDYAAMCYERIVSSCGPGNEEVTAVERSSFVVVVVG